MMQADDGFDRSEVVFSEPEYAQEAVDTAADGAIADLEKQIAWIKSYRDNLKEAIEELATKAKQKFPDAIFATVYNGDPDERWQFTIVTKALLGDVMDLVMPITKAYKDLGIYPDHHPRTVEKSDVA